MHYSKGEHIGAYSVTFQHKEGSYAETYRVKDGKGKTLFLKLVNYNKLKHHQIDDRGRVIEVEIAKLLNHHNICQYVDSDSIMIDGSQYCYLVTEYVSSETLSKRMIREKSFSVYEIKTIAKAVLSALSYLHSLPLPIVHNDVTIKNILVDLNTNNYQDVKLIDFGFARFLNQQPSKPDLRELNAFCLAPERFAGGCSVMSDLYSVGVIMYQLLYGQFPWLIDLSRVPEQDRIDAILAEREKELHIPSIEKFELDEQLVNVICKALCYDTDGRFQTAEEFIKAIDGEIVVERQSTKRRILSTPLDNEQPQRKPEKIKGEGFSAIAGMDDLKHRMQEEVIEPLHNPEEYRRYGITIPNGMLLYGPPGCGKTFFAKHFAEEVGFNFMCITPATLKSRWVNATQENIAKMFKDAEENAPTIIFIDEINEVVPNRESNVHEMSRSAVNEMLAQMDRTGERGIFVVGATNYPHTIDPAILRAGRLENKYYVGVPDKEARKALFHLYLSKRPYDFGLDYDELASLTVDYVSADIQLIVNNASRMALRSHSKITMELLRNAINDSRPSLSKSELERYEKIRAQMEDESISNSNVKEKKIGFK